MAHSKAELAEVAARRAALIKLRRHAVPFDDPRVLALGYTSRGHATKDFLRALTERRDEQRAEVSVYRQEENERLDELIAAVWPAAIGQIPPGEDEYPCEECGEHIPKPDLKAVETVLKLMDRRAKLNGLDMPVKAEVSGPGGGALQIGPVAAAELQQLIALAGDPDDDSDLEDDTDEDDLDDDGDADDA